MLGKASEHRWLLVVVVARPPEETRGQELVVWAHGHTESRFGDQRGGERCGKGFGATCKSFSDPTDPPAGRSRCFHAQTLRVGGGWVF